MGKMISFANQKGGVGKTTSAVNVAASLGYMGRRTLLIDLDPQGNATSGVGVQKRELKCTIRDVLAGEATMAEAVLETQWTNLWLVPSSMMLAGAEFDLFQEEEPYNIMKNALASVKDVFDYIIVDCPPSLGMLTLNSLTASDGLVIPMQCEFYALEGLAQLTNTIRKVKMHYNSSLNITGILLTMYTNRLLLTQQVKNDVGRKFEGKLFETTISRGVKLAEAPGFGMPVLYHDKHCKGAQEYLSVAKELTTRI